ncbi:MAG: FAD binding domain-containing protein [Planctomycetaceae bacterium]
MRPFEYARPQTEVEAVELLSDHEGRTAVLAGGTDIMNLLRRDAIQPQRLVDIKQIESMQGVSRADDGLLVGSLVTLEDALENDLLAEHHSVLQVAQAHKAIQIQQAGTLVGDLCQLPHCWYFRNGYGLLGMENGQSMAEAGDNRYHAIFGNQGPAKFVSGSRFAPAMIAWGAKVRVVGPEGEEFIPLEYFFATPRTDRQGVTVLKPGQLATHVWLPSRTPDVVSGAYEVLELNGLDRPQAAAAVTLQMHSGTVREARIVMGHVAPTPWVAQEAAHALIGQSINAETASRAGDIAVAGATPLSMNSFKVQMARTAVKRSLLRAVGQLEEALI